MPIVIVALAFTRSSETRVPLSIGHLIVSEVKHPVGPMVLIETLAAMRVLAMLAVTPVVMIIDVAAETPMPAT